jgi:hypothetical protein
VCRHCQELVHLCGTDVGSSVASWYRHAHSVNSRYSPLMRLGARPFRLKAGSIPVDSLDMSALLYLRRRDKA